MSVREDQSSCRSVKINHHMAISDRHLSVREGQASSFVSLHQGMRLPDKQTRYRQADKQDNKEDHKVSGFGCSEAPSAYPPTVHNKTPLPLNSRALRALRLVCSFCGAVFSAAQRRSAISAAEHRQSVSRNPSSSATEGGNSSRRTANSSYGSSTKTEVDWQRGEEVEGLHLCDSCRSPFQQVPI